MGHAPTEITPHRETRGVEATQTDVNERELTPVAQSLPNQVTANELRRKLDAAILAERWDAVAIVGARLRELA